MKDRVLWIIASVIVASACVVLFAHRRGLLREGDSNEGISLLGSPGETGGNIPPGWVRPPPIGTDPEYQGPDPSGPMKFSPYAMATSRRVRRRQLPRDTGDEGMAEAITSVIQGVDGRIAYVGSRLDSRFESVGDRIQRVDIDMFDTDDVDGVARRLTESGYAFVLASARDPRPDPAMQTEMHQLRPRLRDGIPLSHFHPVVFGRAHILYRIAEPMEFAPEDLEAITTWVRQRLTGGAPSALGVARSTDTIGRDEHRVIISLRARDRDRVMGRRLVSESAAGETLEAALAATVEQIQSGWTVARAEAQDRYREELEEDLSAAVREMELEIEIVDRMCRIVDREERRLAWQFELGLEGMYLERRDRFHYLSPVTPIQRASGDDFRGERGMLEGFIELSNLGEDAWDRRGSERGPFGVYAYDFGRFETHHFLERSAGGEVIELYRNVPLVTIADVTRNNIVRALQFGAMWLVNNQLDDGQFRYRYKPLEERSSRRWIEGNNIVRHALNPYTLLLVNRVAQDDRLLQAARRGLEYTLEHLQTEGNRCYVWHQDVPAPYENAKMGTVAVTILSILAMADVIDIGDYESVLRCLAEELLYIQDPNGHFRQYDVPEDHAYYGCENSIFPGEMLLALARVYSHTHDERYREAFSRGFEWYTQWWAENVDNRTRNGMYNEEDRMNLVGFVPWNVMALNEMHSETNEERYADFAFLLQDWMDNEFFYDVQRTQYPDYLGAYYKHHWELPAINSNGYTEGAAAAYALALRTGRDVERRRQVLIHGVRFAMQIQYVGYETTFYIPEQQTAMGGWRYNLNFSRSRNDYSYHAMSALSQAVEFLRPQDYPAVHPIILPETLQDAQGVVGELPTEADDAGPSSDGGPVGDARPSGDAGPTVRDGG